MSDHDAFARILGSLYDAMLDDRHWPATSALIDEACGITGNTLLVGEGPKDDIRVLFVGLYYHGQRHLMNDWAAYLDDTHGAHSPTMEPADQEFIGSATR